MAEYTSETIKKMVDNIDMERLILPAMQRNFVWPEQKVYKLFESLMRDYPIGTFLFWVVDNATFNKYVFNTFIKSYDEEKQKMQRGDRATASFSDYTAVLDGQQRITSLYLGVKGAYRMHIKGRKWDEPSSFENKYLCINVMFYPKEDEEFQFEFKRTEEIGRFISIEDGNYQFWLRVSDIFEGKDPADVVEEIEDIDSSIFVKDIRTKARKMLTTLQNALLQKQNVSYYKAEDKSLNQVVEIFVRVNSGGQKLDSSDLMLSVAAGEQGDTDVHRMIQDAVDEINAVPHNQEEGFKVDKGLVLTAGLMLTGAESLSLKKNENWAPSRMNDIFKDHWDSIIEALKHAVDYIEYLGFIGKKLTSKNLVLPIAYYFYKNNLGENHKQASSHRASCDRVFIRQWLIRAMVNNVFTDGTGGTLLAIRNLIDKSDKKHFPLEELMEKGIRRSLNIEGEGIDEILELKYGDTRIVPIFDELTHSTSSSTNQVDHIWPQSVLTSKKKVRKYYPMATDDEIAKYKERCNYFANLQILDQVDNNQKSDTLYDAWLASRYPDLDDLKSYKHTHLIPVDAPVEFKDFLKFYTEREKFLRQKLSEAFPTEFDKLVARYGLIDKLE